MVVFNKSPISVLSHSFPSALFAVAEEKEEVDWGFRLWMKMIEPFRLLEIISSHDKCSMAMLLQMGAHNINLMRRDLSI